MIELSNGSNSRVMASGFGSVTGTLPCVYGPGCLILDSHHQARFNHDVTDRQLPPCADDKCLLYRKLFVFLESQVVDQLPTEDLRQLCQHCACYSHPPITSQDNYIRLLMAGGNVSSGSRRRSIALPRIPTESSDPVQATSSDPQVYHTPPTPATPTTLPIPDLPRVARSAPLTPTESPPTSQPPTPGRTQKEAIPKLNLDNVPARGNVRFYAYSIGSNTTSAPTTTVASSSSSPLPSPKTDRTKSMDRVSPKGTDRVSPKGGTLIRRVLTSSQARSLSQDNSPARERSNSESLQRCINELRADNDALRQELADLRSMIRQLASKETS
jgi:hypothetical protein